MTVEKIDGKWWSDIRTLDDYIITPPLGKIDLTTLVKSTHFYIQERFDFTNYNKNKRVIAFLDVQFSNCVFINMPTSDLIISDCKFTNCTFINTSFTPNFFFFNKIEGFVKFPEAEYSKQKAFLNQWYPLACPEEGSFIGWKKTLSLVDDLKFETGCLVKLEIPADALRSSSFGRKCRASKAKVLSIFNLNTQKYISESYSIQDSSFIYKVGEIVTPQGDPYYEDRFVECGSGIHFYVSKADAINH